MSFSVLMEVAKIRFRSVNIPEKLLQAQESGSLVIFAGAGVSMGEPSNLPSFTALAKQIAEGIVSKTDGEPEDRFLGRVASRGSNVHERARDILDRPDSFPTNVHHAIVSLFKNPDTLRIVTTNFDRHFSTVLSQSSLFQKVNVYKAPALPLGDDFQGLVYLHGTIDDPNRMVLTDGDFGRAYLTQGWATKFLHRLFEQYTVLFIGYSHQDVVMNYLARGLPTSTYRFALTEEGSYEEWQFRGITPVFFPGATGPNKYAELEGALVGWGERTQLSVLDHEHRIQELVSQPALPVNLEDIDYLKGVIRNDVYVKFFTRYAKALYWLDWLENDSTFQRLFDPSEKLSSQEVELALWFANNYSCRYIYESLSVVEKNGSKLNQVAWTAIAQCLLSDDPRPGAETIEKWIAVLLASPENTWNIHLANYLLEKSDGLHSSAISLFEVLTKPRLRLKPHISLTTSDKPNIRADFSLRGEDYWLRQAWNKVFKPNIMLFSSRLEPILVNHIVSAHNSLRSLGIANEEWDPISWGRSAINPHEQDKYPDNVDILIDALRDVIAVRLEDRNFVLSKSEDFANSGVPILKRLAVHLISETTVLTPNTKIRWILRNGFIYSTNLKHEVFRLLKVAYPSTSSRLRSELIKIVLKGPRAEGTTSVKTSQELYQYEIFNILVWLHRSAPECSLVEKTLQEIKRNNPEFRERDNPDFNHWIGPVSWEDDANSVSVDEILNMEPETVVDNLLNLKGEEFDLLMGRNKILETFIQAIQTSFEKTWAIVEKLNGLEVSDMVWRSILRGWSETSLKTEEWKLVLALLDTNNKVLSLSSEIAYLIQKGLNREGGLIPEQCLGIVEHILDNVWSDIQDRGEHESVDGNNESSVRLLLHDSGGQITLCRLYLLSWIKKHSPSSWAGIPQNYRDFFADVVKNEHRAGQSGRAMLAANLSYLFETDAEWTNSVLLPLFDWSAVGDKRKVIDIWTGYLLGGRIHPDLVARFAEWYVQSASMVDELLDVRDRLCADIAWISLYGQMETDKTTWILQCLKSMSNSEHTTWARHLRWELQHAESNVIEKVWNDWIEKYWSRRLLGFPTTLTSEETVEMIEWIPNLLPVFPKVVTKIRETSVPSSLNGWIFHELKELPAVTNWPDDTADLLLHLTRGAIQPWAYLEEIKDIVKELIGKCPHDKLIQICDELARLGYSEASKLQRDVMGSDK